MITIQEHRKIEPDLIKEFNFQPLDKRINNDTSCFVTSKINLMRFEFDPSLPAPKDGFYSYYRIGAEWLDKAQTKALIVAPKFPNIDFIEMFMKCLEKSHPDDEFHKIYDIDLEAKPIRAPGLNSVLSPLLVVQFIMILKQICERGLRKGYVAREENLSKVRGKIDFRKNEILNVRVAHKERIYCRYNEYSVDTPENRYLKRALFIASNMINLMTNSHCYNTLKTLCNQCISSFEGVSESYEDIMILTRHNKLYREYNEALRFARMIIRKEEMNINSRSSVSNDLVPVFRIDMALLFEHYALAILRDAIGTNSVFYQQRGSNAFYPDFLIKKGDFKVIADAKYTEIYNEGGAKGDYVKQLCGYARDIKILRKLEIDCSNENEVPVIACSLIYPRVHTKKNESFNLLENPNSRTVKFYTTTVDLPLI